MEAGEPGGGGGPHPHAGRDGGRAPHLPPGDHPPQVRALPHLPQSRKPPQGHRGKEIGLGNRPGVGYSSKML